VEIKKRAVFDALIERRHGTSINPPKPDANPDEEDEPPVESEDVEEPIPDTEHVVDSTGKRLLQQPLYDKMINAEILLPNGDQMQTGKVKGRSIGDHGSTMGSYSEHPLLNSIVYDVEFPDGQVKEYAANILAENMLSQVDNEGHSYLLMKEIIDWKKGPTAVSMDDKYLITPTGQRRLRKTTQGWSFLVAWKDGTESWVKMKDLKDSSLVELAEFAKARGLSSEPAFAWWISNTIRRRNAILSAVKGRVKKTTHKYGIEIPTSVEHAKKLDAANGNTLWMDALKKEMYNVGIAFEILEDGEGAPKGWHKTSAHLIWDVKMDFTRKCRLVLDGYKSPQLSLQLCWCGLKRECQDCSDICCPQ
jgi:hypothetical protein